MSWPLRPTWPRLPQGLLFLEIAANPTLARQLATGKLARWCLHVRSRPPYPGSHQCIKVQTSSPFTYCFQENAHSWMHFIFTEPFIWALVCNLSSMYFGWQKPGDPEAGLGRLASFDPTKQALRQYVWLPPLPIKRCVAHSGLQTRATADTFYVPQSAFLQANVSMSWDHVSGKPQKSLKEVTALQTLKLSQHFWQLSFISECAETGAHPRRCQNCSWTWWFQKHWLGKSSLADAHLN